MMHTDLLIIGGYWLFSALVGGMPEPSPTSGIAYRWAYSSLHILAGNINLAVQTRYKGVALPPDTVVHSEATIITPPTKPE